MRCARDLLVGKQRWDGGRVAYCFLLDCCAPALQVQFADTKATFILGANSALVSYLFSTPLVGDAGQVANLATALRMMCLLCLLYSSYHVLKVVRPRLVTFTDKVRIFRSDPALLSFVPLRVAQWYAGRRCW